MLALGFYIACFHFFCCLSSLVFTLFYGLSKLLLFLGRVLGPIYFVVFLWLLLVVAIVSMGGMLILKFWSKVLKLEARADSILPKRSPPLVLKVF